MEARSKKKQHCKAAKKTMSTQAVSPTKQRAVDSGAVGDVGQTWQSSFHVQPFHSSLPMKKRNILTLGKLPFALGTQLESDGLSMMASESSDKLK